MTTKTCSRCEETKDTSEFSQNTSRPDDLNSWCKECYREYVKERRDERPERRRRDRWITKTYGKALSRLRERYPDEFTDLLERVREEHPFEG